MSFYKGRPCFGSSAYWMSNTLYIYTSTHIPNCQVQGSTSVHTVTSLSQPVGVSAPTIGRGWGRAELIPNLRVKESLERMQT
jgi:hypothetical protein